MEALEHMRQTEAGVATLWNTAYWLLKLPGAKRKFYFLQDFEPLFYPAGSTSAQAEATYRFGFFGIANTVGIQSIYESEYGGIAEHFDPCVDTAVFYPSVSPPVATPQVFFYGRPDHPRNAFELASAAVRRIKEQCGKRVRIVSAGSEWSPEDYGLGGIVENFGLLSIGQTAEMYRSSTVGLLLMFTRHPSYIPFELMACGCAVVTNQNQATRWFFEDKVNCVVAAPSATCLSQAVVELLNDDKRRGGIVAAAQTRIKERHSDWEAQIEKIYHFMCDPMEGRHSQARIAPISQNSG
jgi:glycosyltransferase involved in cell wall biosynthesis